jgi:acetyl esterase/lipase
MELPHSRTARLLNRTASIAAPTALTTIACLGPVSRAVIPRVRPLVNRGLEQAMSVPKGTRWWPELDSPVPGEWVLGPAVAAEFAARGIESPLAAAELGYGVIYYVHGSGYTVASPGTHRALVSLLSHRSGLPAFGVDYRLGPENHFPAAGDDTIAGFRWLVGAGVAADRIVVSGDSAGGHLGLDLMRCNHLDGVAPPAALVFFSPLLDPSFTLSAAQQRIRRDPAFDAAAARRIVGWYVGGASYDDPRLTIPITPDLPIPPTLIQAGEMEMMSADAREMARQLQAAGGPVTLQIWPDQGHVFQLMSATSRAADRAVTIAADFMRDALGTADRMLAR